MKVRLSVFFCVASSPLREVFEKMRILQHLTAFVIFTLFLKRGVRTSLYFYESGFTFEKGWEPMMYGRQRKSKGRIKKSDGTVCND